MYRGYYIKRPNISHSIKCPKCQKLNPILQSPAFNNTQNCIYCGNPCYIIKIN